MRVFISWSGNRSKVIAEFLRDWIPCVLQAAEPWMSAHDLDRGTFWFGAINDQLKETAVGIVCLTQENKEAPWILFEAGALAKGLTSSRVCTLLIDLEPADIDDPLAQLNHSLPTKDGMWSLIQTLNSSLGASALSQKHLSTAFKAHFKTFDKNHRKALQEPSSGRRSDVHILQEILGNTRALRGLSMGEVVPWNDSVTRRIRIQRKIQKMRTDGLSKDQSLERMLVSHTGMLSGVIQEEVQRVFRLDEEVANDDSY